MDIHEFRKLSPQSQLATLFSENDQIRKEISVMHGEIAHFTELEEERKRLRKRRARVARKLEVGSQASVAGEEHTGAAEDDSQS